MSDPKQTAGFVGTREDAEVRFLKACDLWTASMQPLVAGAAEHRKRGAEEFEARWQLANAAVLLAWFMRQEKTVNVR